MYKILFTTVIGKELKARLLFLLVLGTAAAFCELLTLGAVLPFLTAITRPGYFVSYLNSYNLENISESTVLIIITAIFCAAVLVSSLIRLVFLKNSTQIAANIGTNLGGRIFKNLVGKKYQYFVENNTSNLQSVLTNDINVVTFQVVLPFIVLVSSFIMAVSVASLLMIVNIYVACGAIVLFGGSYIAISALIKKRINRNGRMVADEAGSVLQDLNETFGLIREIKLHSLYNFYYKRFERSDRNLRIAQGENVYLSQFPRFTMEGFGIVIIAIGAVLMILNGDDNIVPTIGVFALASQRLLPSVQQIYWATVNIKSGYPSLKRVVETMTEGESVYFDEPLVPGSKKLTNGIDFINVSFKHHGRDVNVLNGIDLKIAPGDRVGIVGQTGSGKSTFLSLLLGLYEPTCGTILFDNEKYEGECKRNWQGVISYVPQDIFIQDGNFYENIALGIKIAEIDTERVEKVARDAKLHDFICSLPEAYNTNLGERGLKVSGGQKQRVGIARALYRNSQIIVLDEATSALDVHTESEIIDQFNSLSKNITLIVVAHRTTTLENCNRIYELSNGSIVQVRNRQILL